MLKVVEDGIFPVRLDLADEKELIIKGQFAKIHSAIDGCSNWKKIRNKKTDIVGSTEETVLIRVLNDKPRAIGDDSPNLLKQYLEENRLEHASMLRFLALHLQYPDLVLSGAPLICCSALFPNPEPHVYDDGPAVGQIAKDRENGGINLEPRWAFFLQFVWEPNERLVMVREPQPSQDSS